MQFFLFSIRFVVFIFVVLASPFFVRGQYEFSSNSYSVGDRPFQIANGDFNGDSAIDLVVINFDSMDLSILINDGTGIFNSGPNIELDFAQEKFAVSGVAAGDFNNDGFDDIAVTRPFVENFFDDGLLQIFTGIGDGTFGEPVTFEMGEVPTRVVSVDLDGDSDDDLCVLNCESDQLAILINDNDGLLNQPVFLATDENPASIATGDVNGDDIVDIAVASLPTSLVCVFQGNGDGSFSSPENFFVGSLVPLSIDLGDVDVDSDLDLVSATSVIGEITILRNDGNGNYSFNFNDVVDSLTFTLRLVDVDGDSQLELLTIQGDDVLMRPGNGNGSFGLPQSFEIGPSPRDIVCGDFNQDGRLDVVAASNADDTITVLLQTGGVLLGDVNLDGVVNLLDVQPFVNLLTGSQFQAEADINQDGSVNLLDVALLVDLL